MKKRSERGRKKENEWQQSQRIANDGEMDREDHGVCFQTSPSRTSGWSISYWETLKATKTWGGEKKKTIKFYNSIPCSENKFIQSASNDYLAYQWDHGIGRHCMAWITWMSAFLTSYSCHCEPFLRPSVFSIHHLWARLSWMDGIVMVCEQNHICAYAKPPMKPYNKLYGEGCWWDSQETACVSFKSQTPIFYNS